MRRAAAYIFGCLLGLFVAGVVSDRATERVEILDAVHWVERQRAQAHADSIRAEFLGNLHRIMRASGREWEPIRIDGRDTVWASRDSACVIIQGFTSRIQLRILN